jgi:hypothetical protein
MVLRLGPSIGSPVRQMSGLRSGLMKIHGWRTGDIALGWLIALFVVMTGVALGGASIGGWGGVAIIAADLVAVIGVIILWAGAPPREANDAHSEQGEAG